MPIVRWFIGDTQQSVCCVCVCCKKNYINTPYFCYPIGLPNGWQTIFELYSALRFFDGLPPPTSEWRGTKGIFLGNFWIPTPCTREGDTVVKGGGGDGKKKIKKTYKWSFFSPKRGLAQGARDCGWRGGGGRVPPVSLSGPYRGFTWHM